MYLAHNMPRNINLWVAAICNILNLGVTVFWSWFSTVSNARVSHAFIAISLPSLCSELLLLGVASFSLVAIAVGACNEQLQEREQARVRGMLSWRCPPAPNPHLVSAGGAINPTLAGSWCYGQHAACLSTHHTMQLEKGYLWTVLR